MEERELNSNETDAVIGTVRSIVSNIPFAGGYFAEILNDIPNQRIDRIAKYCSYLKTELDKIPLEDK